MAGERWREEVVERVKALMEKEPACGAMIVAGSTVNLPDQVDRWSDVDILLVMADEAVERYYTSTDWFVPKDGIFSLGRFEYPYLKLLEICLTGFRLVEIGVIPESAMRSPPAEWDTNPFTRQCQVVFSRLSDIDELMARVATVPDPERGDREKMIILNSDAFWAKAVIVVKKAARGNLLIATSIALQMARHLIYLKMMLQRDHEGGGYHRTSSG